MANPRGIRWGRVLLGAVVIEMALLLLAIPLLAFTANPFVSTGEASTSEFTTFFASVVVACLVLGGLGGMWVARPLSSGFVLHGALTGIAATAIYLAICSIPPNSIAAVAAAYGPVWFVLANGLRIGGCAAGAALQGRRQARGVHAAV